MSDHDKELRLRVSLLLDGELGGRDNPRLIERIEDDEALKQAWARYHLIGQLMRSPNAVIVDEQFARRVQDAIADEPTVLAPRARTMANPERRQRVIGFALAASLATVAIMVGKSVVDQGGGLYAQIASPHAVASTVGSGTDTQFSDYLLTHNETAYLAGSAGMLPYVRSVSAGVDR